VESNRRDFLESGAALVVGGVAAGAAAAYTWSKGLLYRNGTSDPRCPRRRLFPSGVSEKESQNVS